MMADHTNSEQTQKEDEIETISTPAAAAAASTSNGAGSSSASSSSGAVGANMAQLVEHLGLSALDERRGPKDGKATMKDYKFWATQPVPRIDETVLENGPIEPDKDPSEIRATPYPLPKDFEWSDLDVNDDVQIKELYELLSHNYVEDDDALFRFDYSADFLKWALKPPGWNASWLFGVRVASNKKLVAFISGIPAHLRVDDKSQNLVEINFLCVHKKLRSKRLAPVLIKEVTRRVHLTGIFQAVYTAGVVLPKPIATCRYYHRSLNPTKLIETGFSHLSKNMTMARTVRLYKLPANTQNPGLRAMQPADVPTVTKLLNAYLACTTVAPIFSEADVEHWLLPIPGVVYSYVVEDEGKVTQFASFYSLPSSVIHHPKHTHVRAAYMFYYAPKEGGSDKDLIALVKDMLILACNNQFDVFNCVHLMDNQKFMEELKFGRGDGLLRYYLYNYRCRELTPEKMGLVML
ncbi:glycylpeptide N-tetradecanoyltransferase 1-like protein [Cladochytrium replicatum]|nr:glycylpeptide N-tetradecanoyltransferase 1-like protein [Cladochytrium replicatum]